MNATIKQTVAHSREGADGMKTIHDVAKELGVSASTVSRAISGKGRIGKTTRDRILRYIDESGYYPNAVAQSLAQARTNNIAVILPRVHTLADIPFFHTCIYAIEEMAQGNDYDILVVVTQGRDTRPLERLILNRKVDGMILTSTFVNDCFVPLLKENEIPFVTIGAVTDEDVIQIDNDNAGACAELTGILLSKKIKRIAYLGGNMEQMVNKSRYQGFCEAYRQYGREPEEDIVYTDLDSKVTIEKAVDGLLRKKADCILCQDDFICNEVVHMLADRQIRIPEDIKVASCHYSRILENYPVMITSLKFDIGELAGTACRVLFDLIDGKEVEEKTILDYEIVLEESTK